MKKTPKQIAAIGCVILLVSLYVATFIVAILDFPGKSHLFAACLFATIGLPILLWLTIWSVGKMKKKDDDIYNSIQNNTESNMQNKESNMQNKESNMQNKESNMQNKEGNIKKQENNIENK